MCGVRPARRLANRRSTAPSRRYDLASPTANERRQAARVDAKPQAQGVDSALCQRRDRGAREAPRARPGLGRHLRRRDPARRVHERRIQGRFLPRARTYPVPRRSERHAQALRPLPYRSGDRRDGRPARKPRPGRDGPGRVGRHRGAGTTPPARTATISAYLLRVGG